MIRWRLVVRGKGGCPVYCQVCIQSGTLESTGVINARKECTAGTGVHSGRGGVYQSRGKGFCLCLQSGKVVSIELTYIIRCHDTTAKQPYAIAFTLNTAEAFSSQGSGGDSVRYTPPTGKPRTDRGYDHYGEVTQERVFTAVIAVACKSMAAGGSVHASSPEKLASIELMIYETIKQERVFTADTVACCSRGRVYAGLHSRKLAMVEATVS